MEALISPAAAVGAAAQVSKNQIARDAKKVKKK
jgi:hypothetical protein